MIIVEAFEPGCQPRFWPVPLDSGHWPDRNGTGFWTVIEVKDGDGWKMQNLTFNMTPAPKK
jgi:hypothetical protein